MSRARSSYGPIALAWTRWVERTTARRLPEPPRANPFEREQLLTRLPSDWESGGWDASLWSKR